ncbi:MAG: YceI family protein [Pseudomonadota bacterium]
MRLILTLAALLLWATTLAAAPVRYELDPTASTVGFTWTFEGAVQNGRMPVSRADLTLDFARPETSQINVRLRVAEARAGFPFATQAMRGENVLDATAHPEILFRSTRITGDATRARVEGQLTLRGVTRPITLNAQIFREKGTPAGDFSKLFVEMTGSLNRHDFGASGFRNFVGETVGLRIIVHIRQAN